MAAPGIDPANAQFVGRWLGQVSVMMPRTLMTRQEALVHAAWLVLVADGEDDFAAYLNAVRST